MAAVYLSIANNNFGVTIYSKLRSLTRMSKAVRRRDMLFEMVPVDGTANLS
jgi:hypothetical protein